MCPANKGSESSESGSFSETRLLGWETSQTCRYRSRFFFDKLEPNGPRARHRYLPGYMAHHRIERFRSIALKHVKSDAIFTTILRF